MNQTSLMIKTLKTLLKGQGITYAALAKHLDLSEASVKRMFSSQQFSLQRVDVICGALQIEMVDLLAKMSQLQQRTDQLTWAQEEKIVSDHKLCLITICIINRWTMQDIQNYYKLSEIDCIKSLTELDKIKLIELLPNNKVKLLVASGFRWIQNGPIQTFFQQYIMNDFINNNFSEEDEAFICHFGMLTVESNILFRKKLRLLAEEFMALNNHDHAQPFDKRFGHACVLAVRPWAPAIFDKLIKD
jgi:transcriptional regulator with XRE-family HTH domain